MYATDSNGMAGDVGISGPFVVAISGSGKGTETSAACCADAEERTTKTLASTATLTTLVAASLPRNSLFKFMIFTRMRTMENQVTLSTTQSEDSVSIFSHSSTKANGQESGHSPTENIADSKFKCKKPEKTKCFLRASTFTAF